MKFRQARFYIHKTGKAEGFGSWRTETPAVYNYVLNIIRDKRKLLVEISRRGDVYLSFKDIHLKLTFEQIQQLCGFWKNLKVKENPSA